MQKDEESVRNSLFLGSASGLQSYGDKFTREIRLHTGGAVNPPPTAHEAPLLALAIALHLAHAALLVLQLLCLSVGRILLLLQDLLLLLVHVGRV